MIPFSAWCELALVVEYKRDNNLGGFIVEVRPVEFGSGTGWRMGGAQFDDNPSGYIDGLWRANIQVFGNIYENPELIS